MGGCEPSLRALGVSQILVFVPTATAGGLWSATAVQAEAAELAELKGQGADQEVSAFFRRMFRRSLGRTRSPPPVHGGR
jgi:tRNA A37 threonylcarbamoyladenosine synthetase subunit TsaC/SUA5/YrdC